MNVLKAGSAPSQATRAWCKWKQDQGWSMEQMATDLRVTTKQVKRLLRDYGLSVPERIKPGVVKRQRAFFKAMAYANSLKRYPELSVIEKKAAHLAPFCARDLVGMLETRGYRGLAPLKRRRAAERACPEGRVSL